MNNKVIYLAAIIVLVVLGIWYFTREEKFVVTKTFVECVDQGGTIMETYPRQCKAKNGLLFVEDIGDAVEKVDLIKVFSPSYKSSIKTPVTITGEARGNWFFEASFPIEIKDNNGKVIGNGIAQAIGEWMTEDFVPFEAEIEFTSPGPNQSGTIVLHKDNPSGLPQNDDSLSVPIVFK